MRAALRFQRYKHSLLITFHMLCDCFLATVAGSGIYLRPTLIKPINKYDASCHCRWQVGMCTPRPLTRLEPFLSSFESDHVDSWLIGRTVWLFGTTSEKHREDINTSRTTLCVSRCWFVFGLFYCLLCPWVHFTSYPGVFFPPFGLYL